MRKIIYENRTLQITDPIKSLQTENFKILDKIFLKRSVKCMADLIR